MNCFIAGGALLVCCCIASVLNGEDLFLNSYVPKMEALIEKDLSDLGEITCTYQVKDKEPYFVKSSISEPFAVLKFRKGGKGWDSIRNPDYYAALRVTKDKTYSITYLSRKSDPDWNTIWERRKLPMFALVMTGRSTLPTVARSNSYSVVHEAIDGGDRFTMSSNREGTSYHRVTLDFDSQYDFPSRRKEFFDNELSRGNEYVVRRFQRIGDVSYPVEIDVTKFGPGNSVEMTIKTTFDPTIEFNTEACQLEFYGLTEPGFELAKKQSSHLPAIIVTAIVLMVVFTGIWYYCRA